MAHAAWKSLKGPRRVQAEYKHLDADIRANKFGFIKELSLPSDDMNVWELKLWKFDDDLPGGKQLNQDLERLKQYGQDHLLMRIEFPTDYPHKPFFVRLVSPRCVMYTGHVTAGGSICLEALTLSGTPGSWQPDFTVESLINVVVINMIDCPVTYVQTATGPGGRSGPLRIDFSRGSPTSGYSSEEAKAAFHRTLANHQRMGWGHGDNTQAAGTSNRAAAGVSRPAAAVAAAAAAAAAVGPSGFGGLGGFSFGGGFGSFGAGSGAAAAAQHLQQLAPPLQPWQVQLPSPHRKKRSPQKNGAAAAAGGGAAAAAAGDAAGPSARKRSRPAAAHVINLCDDEDSDDPVVVGVKPAAAPAAAEAAAAAAAGGDGAGPSRQPRKKQRAIVVADDDSEDSVKAQLVIPPQQLQDDAGSRPQRSAALAARQAMSPTSRGPKRNAAAAGGATAAPWPRQQAGAEALGLLLNNPYLNTFVQGQPAPPFPAAAPPPPAGAAGGASGTLAQIMQRARQAVGYNPPAQDPALPVVAAIVQEQLVVDGVNGAPKVQLELELPAHWDFRIPMQRDTVRFIDLPLNNNSNNAPAAVPEDPLEIAARGKSVDEADVSMLTQQGLSRADALAALLMGGGSTDDALDCAFNCQDLGGAAKVWTDMQPVRAVDDLLQASETAARARALADEAESILKHLEKTAGHKLTRNKVVKIERIQHAKLWRRFALRRSELVEARGRNGVNEHLLFHGTSPGTADRIVQEGFDMRLVNHASAYGNGVYFADHSSTAYDYCLRPDNAGAAAGFGAGGPGNFAGVGASAALQARLAAAMGAPGFGAALGLPGGRAAAGAYGQPAAGQYKMIIARVALGKQTKGQVGMRRPPDGYDSVNSGTAGGVRSNSKPYCHVVFDNDQCYPEYLITWTP